jgi:hypothetical protein
MRTAPKEPPPKIYPNGEPKEAEKRFFFKDDEMILSLFRWALYSGVMMVLLIPHCAGWKLVTAGLILGHFAAQINSIKNK